MPKRSIDSVEQKISQALERFDDNQMADIEQLPYYEYREGAFEEFCKKADTLLGRKRRSTHLRRAAIFIAALIMTGALLYQIPAVRAFIRRLFVLETPVAYHILPNEWKRVYDDYMLTTLTYKDSMVANQDGTYTIEKPDTPLIYFRRIEAIPALEGSVEERQTVQGSPVYIVTDGSDNYLYWEYWDGTNYELRSECDVEILMTIAHGLIYELPPTAPPYEAHGEHLNSPYVSFPPVQEWESLEIDGRYFAAIPAGYEVERSDDRGARYSLDLVNPDGQRLRFRETIPDYASPTIDSERTTVRNVTIGSVVGAAYESQDGNENMLIWMDPLFCELAVMLSTEDLVKIAEGYQGPPEQP